MVIPNKQIVDEVFEIITPLSFLRHVTDVFLCLKVREPAICSSTLAE